MDTWKNYYSHCYKHLFISKILRIGSRKHISNVPTGNARMYARGGGVSGVGIWMSWGGGWGRYLDMIITNKQDMISGGKKG